LENMCAPLKYIFSLFNLMLGFCLILPSSDLPFFHLLYRSASANMFVIFKGTLHFII